jgi:hypothetical protein
MIINKQSTENGNKYFASVIYQLTDPDFGKKYGGQICKILRQELKKIFDL